MAKRQREWAKRARARLVEELGGRCEDCGRRESLEIDHRYRRRWNLRRLDPSARVSRYRKEAALGLVRVSCSHCNASKGQPAEDIPAEICALIIERFPLDVHVLR